MSKGQEDPKAKAMKQNSGNLKQGSKINNAAKNRDIKPEEKNR